MNKFMIVVSSFLTISHASWSNDFSSWSSDDFNDCTRSNPCYFENGDFHHVGSGSEDPWNSYTIPSFIVNTSIVVGVSFVAPVVHNALNRFLDYAAYRWEFWRGLRDSGGVAQTDQLRNIAEHFEEAKNGIGVIEDVLKSRILEKNEQKEALSGPLKLVSDAIENGNEHSLHTNNLIAQVLKENGENSSKIAQHLIQIQKNIAEQNKETIAMVQKGQKEMSQNLTRALTSFTMALNELKNQES